MRRAIDWLCEKIVDNLFPIAFIAFGLTLLWIGWMVRCAVKEREQMHQKYETLAAEKATELDKVKVTYECYWVRLGVGSIAYKTINPRSGGVLWVNQPRTIRVFFDQEPGQPLLIQLNWIESKTIITIRVPPGYPVYGEPNACN